MFQWGASPASVSAKREPDWRWPQGNLSLCADQKHKLPFSWKLTRFSWKLREPQCEVYTSHPVHQLRNTQGKALFLSACQRICFSSDRECTALTRTRCLKSIFFHTVCKWCPWAWRVSPASARGHGLCLNVAKWGKPAAALNQWPYGRSVWRPADALCSAETCTGQRRKLEMRCGCETDCCRHGRRRRRPHEAQPDRALYQLLIPLFLGETVVGDGRKIVHVNRDLVPSLQPP